MFSYYLRLAVLSMRKNAVLSSLMIIAIGLGIGACMTIITVNYIMSSDPIPHKSAQLFAVQLDTWSPHSPFQEPDRPPDQVTYLDATRLMEAKRGFRQTANAGAGYVVEPENQDIKPFQIRGRANFADFFAMFDTPFIYGGGWDAEDDNSRALVTVLSRELNDRLFGGENSVGRSVRMAGQVFQVVGVMDDWSPIPRFYDLTTNPYAESAEAYVPFHTHVDNELPGSGNTNCWKPPGDGLEAFLNSECVWIQFWVELPSLAEQQAYRDYLDSYANEQKALGRFERPLNNRIQDVNAWLNYNEVVAEEAQVMLAIALMFLTVCLLNTIGLLLSKFVGKAGEIGLRRALGATRGTLFAQYMIEAAMIGLLGGALGVVLSWLGLAGLDLLFGQLISNLTQMDWVMVLTAVALALLSSIAAGLYPTWKACNIQPSAQLKAQ